MSATNQDNGEAPVCMCGDVIGVVKGEEKCWKTTAMIAWNEEDDSYVVRSEFGYVNLISRIGLSTFSVQSFAGLHREPKIFDSLGEALEWCMA